MANYSAGTLEVALVTSAEDVADIFATLNKQLSLTNRLVKSIIKTVHGKRLNKIVSNSNAKNKNQSNGTFGFLNSFKWTAVIYLGRKLGTTVSNIARHGADYTETLNLWETSMGSNVDQATQFVDKMNEAYGISEKTLMNAQAIFKNMLGSLGQITDTMAYQLSEGITQMAVDYASLYNVTFEQAFSKFQAVLAGQVRPIRSVAGYDITETTLFQLYQSIGGQKSMRQLTRTEKQLLSILAVFEQMERSGALGDLKKTMSTFANQTRIMAEAWQQATTYAGALITYSIQESGILTKINAILIFVGNVLEALAEEMGAIQSFGGGIFEDLTDGANSASLALDEVNGKLLDFDKFRALSGQDNSDIGLDEKLISALSGYDTILKNASLEAEKLAKHFGEITGLFDKDGVFNKEKWDDFVDTLKDLGQVLTILVVGATIDKLTKSIKALSLTTSSFQSILVGGIIYAFWEMIEAIQNGETEIAILAGTIGGMLTVVWIGLNKELVKTVFNFGKIVATEIHKAFIKISEALSRKLIPNLTKTRAQVTGLQMAFTALSLSFAVASFSAYMSSEASAIEKFTTSLEALALALTAGTIAYYAFKQNWAKAVAVGGLVAGGVFTVKSAIQDYKDGGMPDKGTIFRAGEAGAEIVYDTPSGQSGVANISQIEQAQYNALVRYEKTYGKSRPVVVYLDGQKVYENTTAHAKKEGNFWSK